MNFWYLMLQRLDLESNHLAFIHFSRTIIPYQISNHLQFFWNLLESHYLPINLASYRFLGVYLKMMKFFRGVKRWRLLSKNFNIYWFLILLINSFSLFQFLLLVVEVLYTWIHWKSRKVHSKNKLLLQRVCLRMLYFQLIFVMHYWCYLWNLICIF